MRKTKAMMVLSITLCLFSVTAQTDSVKESKTGKASYYASHFEGRRTATGEIFKQTNLTAASNRYKLGTVLQVTNNLNGKSVVVRINDRMGHKTRLIDLSSKAAKLLGFYGDGITDVTVTVFEG
jgi:rare lipoprotein A